MVVAGLVLIAVAVIALLRVYASAGPGSKRSAASIAAPLPADEEDAPDDEPVVHSLRPWVLRGIDAEDAKKWIDRGFDADHAYLFQSLEVDPRTAARLREAGLEDSALVALVEDASFGRGVSHDDLIALAERAPHLAAQAVSWLGLGVTKDQALAYAAAEFTPAASDPWRAAGWDMDDALPWFVERFEPISAKAWRASEFSPVEARAWKREHFGVKQAVEWRRLGDTPARAREVEVRFNDARVTVADGLRWLDRGFSVEEICAGWPAMAKGSDAGSWRNDWKGRALSPAEVTSWHTKFSHDEAMRWIDAGVRDPESAIRLQRRGFGPQHVERVVADRLADVFNQVPVTRDDLLSAAGQLARAGGAPRIRYRLQRAAAGNNGADPKEVSADLIGDVLDELKRLDDLGALGAPHAARALARRLERGLIVSALITGRAEHVEASRAV